MLLPIFLPEMLSDMLALWFGMTLPLLSFKPDYVLMLLIHIVIFRLDIKKKKCLSDIHIM